MPKWHGGVDVKKKFGIAGLSATLVVMAGSVSFALEEQKVGAPPAPAAAATDSAAAVQPGAAVAKPDAGTEIRIPGLGKLGTLPKMDFGLELLYGAAETSKPQEPETPADQPGDDLTIRGSIKHRF